MTVTHSVLDVWIALTPIIALSVTQITTSFPMALYVCVKKDSTSRIILVLHVPKPFLDAQTAAHKMLAQHVQMTTILIPLLTRTINVHVYRVGHWMKNYANRAH